MKPTYTHVIMCIYIYIFIHYTLYVFRYIFVNMTYIEVWNMDEYGMY